MSCIPLLMVLSNKHGSHAMLGMHYDLTLIECVHVLLWYNVYSRYMYVISYDILLE